jgi:hypothetical protein
MLPGGGEKMPHNPARSLGHLACLLIFLLPATAGATEVQGYGPWKFGMKPAEVEAVQEFGPYTPVQATGGLETRNGDFLGQKTPISFVFRPAGLHHIQIWVYTGESYGEALAALHRTYRYLADNYGSLTSTGGPIPSDLDVQQLMGKLGPEFSEPKESLLPKIEQLKSFQAHMISYRIEPVALPTPGRDVHADLIRSPEIGIYYVFLYYRAPLLGK